MIRTFFMISLFLLLPLSAQQRTVTGTVKDRESGQPLPSATVRIAGSMQGTITNAEGEFRLPVSGGDVLLTASYIGFESDTTLVDASRIAPVEFRLTANAVQLAAVTVTDEDPAYEIIRQAIESKKKWMAKLRTFEGKAFNRMEISTDSSIAAIMEGYSTLYWKNGDSLREVVTQQKKTGNLPAAMISVRTGDVVNFNDDRIRLGGFQFTGPTAPDAFDVYDYRLRSTRKMDGYDIHTIELIPRSAVRPLFRGTISIAERSFAVMEVDVRPNEAARQLFVDTRNSRYTQSFRLYDNTFWLPVSFRFEAEFLISVAGISFPAFGIERDVVVYDYSINPVFHDSIATLTKLTLDSSAVRYDSLFWAANEILPLDSAQRTAYSTLDSTQTLEKRFAPKGAGGALLGMSDGPLSFAEVWFNRVEGLHLGVSKTFRQVMDDLDLRGGFGYGLSDKEWKWNFGGTLHFGPERASSGVTVPATAKKRLFELSMDLYDTQVYFPEPLLPGLFLNSFSAILLKEDVEDYYRTAGGSAAVSYIPSSVDRLKLSIVSEQQLSVYQHTNYSLLRKGTAYAPQPGIFEGRMNAVTLEVKHGSAGLLELSKQGYRLSAVADHATSLFGGGFDLSRLQVKLRGKLATIFTEEMLLPPSLGVQLSGGIAGGRVPPQRYFELYARFETFAGYGTLKGLPRREFYGDRYVAVTMDHNFRKVLFAPLGITALMESNLELIVEANAARSWFSSRELRTPLFPAKDSNGWYYEASIGVTNIADLFRFDVTRRLSSPAAWAFTLTASEFLSGMIAQ